MTSGQSSVHDKVSLWKNLVKCFCFRASVFGFFLSSILKTLCWIGHLSDNECYDLNAGLLSEKREWYEYFSKCKSCFIMGYEPETVNLVAVVKMGLDLHVQARGVAAETNLVAG